MHLAFRTGKFVGGRPARLAGDMEHVAILIARDARLM
jgi:hypothetical protein